MSAIQMLGWPVVSVSFNYPATDQDALVWMQELSALLEKKQRFTLIMQAKPNSELSPAARKQLGLWFKDSRQQLAAYCCGVVRLVHSKEEGDRVVSDKMQKAMPFPMKAVLDWSEARDWAVAQLNDI